jgi:hypothetical protein
MPKKHPIHMRVLSSRALREILDTNETIAANGHRARGHLNGTLPFRSLREAIKQFLVNAAETAVAENGEDISGLCFFDDEVNDFGNSGKIPSGAAKVFDVLREAIGIQPLGLGHFMEIGHGGHDGEVGKSQRLGEFFLENTALGRIRARFKKHPQSRTCVALAQSGNG